jgi:hypothetical protein
MREVADTKCSDNQFEHIGVAICIAWSSQRWQRADARSSAALLFALASLTSSRMW